MLLLFWAGYKIEEVREIECKHENNSCTSLLFNKWSQRPGATLGALISLLAAVERYDLLIDIKAIKEFGHISFPISIVRQESQEHEIKLSPLSPQNRRHEVKIGNTKCTGMPSDCTRLNSSYAHATNCMSMSRRSCCNTGDTSVLVTQPESAHFSNTDTANSQAVPTSKSKHSWSLVANSRDTQVTPMCAGELRQTDHKHVCPPPNTECGVPNMDSNSGTFKLQSKGSESAGFSVPSSSVTRHSSVVEPVQTNDLNHSEHNQPDGNVNQEISVTQTDSATSSASQSDSSHAAVLLTAREKWPLIAFGALGLTTLSFLFLKK